MSETFGSQVFGGWYDTLSWFLFSAIWLYLAFATSGFPPHVRQRLPSFILSKPTCLLIATLLAMLALYSASSHQPLASDPVARPFPSRIFNWREIEANGHGDSISVDIASASQDGELVEYWSKIFFKVPRKVGASKYASTFIDKYVVNCKRKTLSHVISMTQSAEGAVINHFELSKKDQTFLPVATDAQDPDSMLVPYVCLNMGSST
jgi:hypothetical protein